MTEPKKRNSTSLMLLLLYALLIASLLVLTLAGARLYSDTMDARDAHAKQRSALSYIQSQTAACGGKGNIRLIDGPEGLAVCLREPESDFETRIYLYENALRTEFSRVTAEIDPNNAEKLCDLKTFKAELSESGLLMITADGMTAGAYCDGGGAA